MTAVVKTPVIFLFIVTTSKAALCGMYRQNRSQPLSSILVSKSFMVYSGEMPPIRKLSDVVSQ